MLIEQWAVLIIAVLLIGISKAAFAGSLGLLALPLLLLSFEAPTALSLLLPLLIAADALTLHQYWRQWSMVDLKRLLPAALGGILVGALLLGKLNTAFLQGLVGAASVLFALNYFLQRGKAATWLANSLGGGILGFVAGLSSTLLHAGGPPIKIYLLARQLPYTTYLGTAAVFFALTNWLKVPAYIWQGQLTLQHLYQVLPLLPLSFIAIKLGVYLKKRLPERIIIPLIYSLLFLAGARLLWTLP
ncbi:sulfite exporter TauE/SafE family protein [Alishewanella sp. 16-MA]|uniref:Probable membrane transporter protein n=1 Tax=Alishewanella maricola TaxID=2795740 RepID=A0ABS8C3Q4_9ALTE|nr:MULTISPECIES: sulfite exporter TauE/SafE family protein [Alishewanella]MDP4946173.1 sulfite exporter TauE/SafE family protein [Alishewanella sp.]MCB5226964.1 sulfite exporter TauE/SafE family protein [Alishewanella maricola]MDP5034758.1 sulfite exporter TauE/SafE family protein [Alishewanella sp.]MDP5185655.1 sulfite exporter TauE/SafE family protein [Alishewanella sp.]MDP5459553.1 sulfite exporter TauE/SafE family protein [Alishewanella sp. SMS8]